MSTGHGEDLGHGVYASPSINDELIVISPRLALGWRVTEGRTPGSAVLWRDQSYEVVGREPAGAGDRWVLRLWDTTAAMRTVYTLDKDSVAWLAEGADLEKRDQRTRAGTLLLLPILGLAPAEVQKRWADTWEFDPQRATIVSAFGEMIFGGVCLLELTAMNFGASMILPTWLRWMAFLGPVLFISGIARLILAFADGEPVGSLIGAPFALLQSRAAGGGDDDGPTVRRLSEEEGIVEIVSPVHRKDWDHDGVLNYRDEPFRLDRVLQEGRSWVYRFRRCSGRNDGGRVLSLKEPAVAASVEPRTIEAPSSILRTTLVTTGVSLGPRSDQERWAAHLGINAIWLTVISAGAELVGGITNLGEDLGSVGALLVAFDFFLVGEGLLRLGSVMTGRPKGSVFGWALRPLYRRHLPAAPSPPINP